MCPQHLLPERIQGALYMGTKVLACSVGRTALSEGFCRCVAMVSCLHGAKWLLQNLTQGQQGLGWK